MWDAHTVEFPILPFYLLPNNGKEYQDHHGGRHFHCCASTLYFIIGFVQLFIVFLYLFIEIFIKFFNIINICMMTMSFFLVIYAFFRSIFFIILCNCFIQSKPLKKLFSQSISMCVYFCIVIPRYLKTEMSETMETKLTDRVIGWAILESQDPLPFV